MRNDTAFMANILPIIVPTVPGMPLIPTSMVSMPTASVTSVESPINVATATTPDFVDLIFSLLRLRFNKIIYRTFIFQILILYHSLSYDLYN